jgi:hypothetical protein
LANKQKGYVEVDLDKKRKLKYDLNSLAEIEDKLGVTIAKLGEVEMGAKQIRVFLWAGLIHEDENITEREVGGLVNFENMEYINDKIGEAFALGTGKNQTSGSK